MIFRQIFDHQSSTYTYLIASRIGGEAVILDPVIGRVDHYVRLLKELGLRLVKVIDTHMHADHISGLGELRNRTRCITVMGEKSEVDLVSMRVDDGDRISAEGISLEVIYTPGHTDDSCSFLMGDRVFTGDTLLIRGTGRTDFQNGDPRKQYHSLFKRLLMLPDETLVFPAHDYKGDTVSTIGEERRFNPRLQVSSVDEYVDLMSGLKLSDPKMMDVAIAANRNQGLSQDRLPARGLELDVRRAESLLRQPEITWIDLRESGERRKQGVIPCSLHVPYPIADAALKPGGILHHLSINAGHRLVFYCSYGERSAMVVEAACQAGLAGIHHLRGGFADWKMADRPVSAAEAQW